MFKLIIIRGQLIPIKQISFVFKSSLKDSNMYLDGNTPLQTTPFLYREHVEPMDCHTL